MRAGIHRGHRTGILKPKQEFRRWGEQQIGEWTRSVNLEAGRKSSNWRAEKTNRDTQVLGTMPPIGVVGVLEEEREGRSPSSRTRGGPVFKRRWTEKTTCRHLTGKLVKMKDKEKNP